jgi:putative selenium metabolism protein SsnA
MTLVLAGGRVVTSLDPVELLDADVTIDGDRIVAVGGDRDGDEGSASATRFDVGGCLVIPGNVCAHHHLYSSLARGMPYSLEPPRNFVEILQRIWWRLDRALDEEAIRASALVGGAAALLAGTTTVIDHHASPNAIDGSLDVVADALGSLGLRSVLSYEVTDRDGPPRAAEGVHENERFLRTRRPLARGHVGAHASFTMSDATLAASVELADRTGTGLHIHVAEDAADQADALARFGRSVARRLADAGALTERALLAHCIHLDDADTELIRDAGSSVAHNPTSNMNNSVGHARVDRLGPHVALGTDGIGGDLFAESKAAYFRARDDDLDRSVGWPLGLLGEGARLAGRVFDEPDLGRIAPGAPADLAVLDYAAPTPLSAGNLAGHLLFGIDAGAVRDVIVAGELVVRDRRLVKVDQGELTADAVQQAARLWERFDAVPEHHFQPVGG